MDLSEVLDKAQAALKVKFNDLNLLRVALTHSSFAYEIGGAEFNEKLEFLGDSVLGIIVTEFIFHRFPQMQEGNLAKLRANLVKAETLAEVAAEIDLGSLLLIGKGAEASGGRENESILADCLEALIGAVYLDQGYKVTKELVLKLLEKKIFAEAQKKELGDPKTLLQEMTMNRWSVLPDYHITDQKGPAHRPIFQAEVVIHGQVFGRGVGTSKKKAEQLAAKEALKEISKLEF